MSTYLARKRNGIRIGIGLTILLAVTLWIGAKLQQNNLFTKSIYLSSNYFLHKSSGAEEETFLPSDIYVDEEYEVCDSEPFVLEIPYISQEGILPNGCEAVSATMLLQNLGFEISAEEFVNEYLVCEDVSIFFGVRFGPNPQKVYAGDPYSEENGYGCFAPVIIDALETFLPEEYEVVDLLGSSLEELMQNYVANGIPVAVWGTIGMEESDKYIQWLARDFSESYLYPVNEHCMVLCGSDGENYYFADPYDSNGIVAYTVESSVEAYESLGMQAVAVLPQEK